MLVYDVPEREGYGNRNKYDKPYEERRQEVPEVVSVVKQAEVESSLPPEEGETPFVSGKREEVDKGVPVLKDPKYRLPQGYQEKPDEKKPVNAIK